MSTYSIQITPDTKTFPSRTFGLSDRGPGTFRMDAGEHGSLRSKAAKLALDVSKASGVKHEYCVYVLVNATGAGIWEPTDVKAKTAEIGEWEGRIHGIESI